MARISESGQPIEPVYGPKALQDFDSERDLGGVGEPPSPGGGHPPLSAGGQGTGRGSVVSPAAAAPNRRYQQLIAAGTTGLSVAFDLPTQMGYDSDAPQARGEVGKVGVAIDSIEDMQTLLHGIPLDSVSTSMTINAPAAVLLLLYELVASEQGVAPDKLTGTIQNDILKEYIARGTYIYPPAPSLRLVSDTFAYCGARIPRWNTISISGYHMAEAGATPVQEIAFTLANAKEYVRAAIAAGLAVDDFAPRLSFFFVARTTLLEEVAKFRAARWLWAHIMADEFGAADPRSQMLRFHTQTAGVHLTAQQPDVNLARVTVQALAAILGGTQSLHTNSYDEAIALPTEKAARLALRTQQVLAYETDLTATADPLAGSFAIESMTADNRDEADELIKRGDEMGGPVAGSGQGFQKAEIERSAYLVAQQIDAGERVVVGVNKFTTAADETYAPLRVDPAIEQQQTERLAALRRQRGAAEARRGIAGIKRAPAGDDNVLYPLRSALAARAAGGEGCDALRDGWGLYRPADVY